MQSGQGANVGNFPGVEVASSQSVALRTLCCNTIRLAARVSQYLRSEVGPTIREHGSQVSKFSWIDQFEIICRMLNNGAGLLG